MWLVYKTYNVFYGCYVNMHYNYTLHNIIMDFFGNFHSFLIQGLNNLVQKYCQNNIVMYVHQVVWRDAQPALYS